MAWLSFTDFYGGRAAYAGTAELGIYVDARARGRGVGRALVGRAVVAAPGLGIDRLLATIFAHNAPSVALFERYGFTRWGLLPGIAVLDEVRRDVVLLGREL